jgi:flagellar biosynthesis protein FliR
VFSESFALRIYLGTTLLGMSFGLAAQVMTDLLKDAPEQMMRFIP